MYQRSFFRTLFVVLTVCACGLFQACGKKTESGQGLAESTPEVAELTKQVRRFSVEKRRLPQNLEELVTVGYIKSIPVAPAGKKYVLDGQRAVVVLVDQ